MRERFFLIKKILVTFLWLFIFIESLILIKNIFTGTNPSDRPKYTSSGIEKSLGELKNKNLVSFKDYSSFFTDLAEKRGAEYAFDVLKKAEINPNIDMHLLGHVVGDILFKQKGAEGITVCTDDFRNACSHSIVVGLFFRKGEGALQPIEDACRRAPGGSGAYTMCFHGLGHGIFTYSKYELAQAISLCKKVGTSSYNYQESNQCISGAVMEIISGGFHNRELWQKQRPNYLKPDNPLDICANDLMPDLARPLCYLYLTPYLFEVVGTDMAHPGEEDFKKAFKFCDKLPINDFATRDVCFGGFGKEFIALLRDRDIRKSALENMSDEQLKKIYQWCKLSANKDGTRSCMLYAMNSLYWGGENNRNLSIRYCNLISDKDNQDSCFNNLIGAVDFYIKDNQYKRDFCTEIPQRFVNDCKAKLKI